MPHFDEIPKLDFEISKKPINAIHRQFLIKDPIDELIERVDKLLSLLEADNSVIITGKRAIEMFERLNK